MADRQLDLFGEMVADPPALVSAQEFSQAGEPTRSHDFTLVASDDASGLIGDDSLVHVEPYRFSLTDPEGRWTIAAAHEDEVKRGKVTRRMVGRCSCG